MTTFVEDIDRKVVPGWRDSLTTAAIGELDSLETPTQVKLSSRNFFWKKRAREGLGDVFAGKVEKRQRGSEAETKELYAKIGELTVEKDFLSKALDR